MGETSDGSLAQALGRIPSGLFVLTARHGEHETGMLASWVQQCSFDPPQLTIAVNKERYLLEWLSPGDTFVVNILPENGKTLIGHFGKGFDRGEPAFTGLNVRRDGGTPPILLAAHAYLECRVANQLDAGDHMLILGRIIAGEVLSDATPYTHIRKNGLRY